MTTLKTLLAHTFDDTDLSDEETRHLAKIVDDACGGDISMLKPLAAALAYGMDEDNAKKAIQSGQYTFFDADNCQRLGKAIVKAMQGNIPDGIADYFDYERLGEDFCAHTDGKLTRYGFFVPREWDNLQWLLK